jgi:D-galactarolactone isomerase
VRLKTPKGACDTHIHLYDGSAAAPGTPNPGIFTLPMYRDVQDRLGLERVVLVQPNAYRHDNAVVLNAMKELGKAAKGVAVVRPGTAAAELERLTRAGVCGIRFMTLPGGTLGFDVMDEVVGQVHPFGWHANVQLDGRDLPKHEAQIKRLPGRFVIDHTGKFLEPVDTSSEPFRCLLRLVDTGRCWVKLAAPYETSKTGGPKYADVGRLAKALVKHAPERMLWASNWPHPSAPKDKRPADEDMLDLLLEWAPVENDRRKILVDNPAELYGFE